MNRKIYIIGSNGMPARYGGFETFAENIGKRLSHEFDVHIACSNKFYKKNERSKHYGKVSRFFIPLPGNGILSILYDFISLFKAARGSEKSDIILILGTTSGYFLPLFRKLKKQKVIVHIDGIEWKRLKWGKTAKSFLKTAYRLVLRFADIILIDNEVLKTYVPPEFSDKTLLCSYGSDHLPVITEQTSPVNQNYALVIARAEPENNISIIVESILADKNLSLLIISNYKHTRYGKRLFKKYSVNDKIIFIDAIYNNPIKLQQYREFCQLYIHGHAAGGTNPSLVEAMNSNIPVVAWDNEFNRSTTNNESIYFRDKEGLVAILKDLESLKMEQMPKRLKQYAAKNYQWDKVVAQLKSVMQ